MAKNDHHVFADSAKALEHTSFKPLLVCRPIASVSTWRRQTAAG